MIPPGDASVLTPSFSPLDPAAEAVLVLADGLVLRGQACAHFP